MLTDKQRVLFDELTRCGELIFATGPRGISANIVGEFVVGSRGDDLESMPASGSTRPQDPRRRLLSGAGALLGPTWGGGCLVGGEGVEWRRMGEVEGEHGTLIDSPVGEVTFHGSCQQPRYA